jgi:hypothetical protein
MFILRASTTNTLGDSGLSGGSTFGEQPVKVHQAQAKTNVPQDDLAAGERSGPAFTID